MSAQAPSVPTIVRPNLFPGQYPQTPIRSKRKLRSVSNGNAGPQSSPAAAVPEGLTPDRPIRQRAVSAGRAPASRLEQNDSPDPKRPASLVGLSAVRQRPSLNVRPKPQNTNSMPEVPSSKGRKRDDLPRQEERAQTDPLPIGSHFSQIDRQIQIKIAQGPNAEEKKNKRKKAYGYTYLFKVKLGDDGPCVLKVGFTADNPNKRVTAVAACLRPAKIEEHPDAIAHTAPFYWLAEKLVHLELEPYRYDIACKCNKKHREYFQVPEEVALDALHRWRLFCGKRPWDEAGDLKARWVQRLQSRCKYDDKSPGSQSAQSRRLASHWKAFTDPWWIEGLCNDTSDVLRRLFTWRLHFLALGEAFALALRIPLHSWAPYWVGLVVLLVFAEFANIEDMYTTDRIANLFKGGWQKLYIQLDGIHDTTYATRHPGQKELDPFVNDIERHSETSSDAGPDDDEESLLQPPMDDEVSDEDVDMMVDGDEDMELPQLRRVGIRLEDSTYSSDSD